ncbi:MAG: hypothetical protein M0Q23_05405 [Syntrophales bacterium]|jgi:YHS domain-containing protein|nr:hypothetical protein [Syntrophales bacterium]MCK9528072.1 hypothetical protein [Syntrophales bacterium]MDX9922332.1 hypothetical protein [Syntrophales bacterium]
MIVRLILLIVILYLAYRAARYLFQVPGEKDRVLPRRRSEIASEDLVKDPQCGTYVPVNSALTATIEGEVHHFCSEECRDRYRQSRRQQ